VNERFIVDANGATVPDRNEQYLFYQTLIATWPFEESDWPKLVRRLQDYMLKAVREAKVHTRWSEPNEPHENALCEFVASVLDRSANAEFLASFDQFQKRTALYGMLNGLSQAVLKVACPGVPDVYQGSDLWDFRLVDPDNRDPINFKSNMSMFAALRVLAAEADTRRANDLLASWCDARVKLHVLSQALNARRAAPGLFLEGIYLPLEAAGEQRDRVIAFARMYENDWAIAVLPRTLAAASAPIVGRSERTRFWQEAWLTLPANAPRRWWNILAGKQYPSVTAREGKLSLADIFSEFPVALLRPFTN
jgi:(1->4)-alpha-D-glucan 1-alpha-D-glucosylmutase